MSVLERPALEASPLADLHTLASELSLDGYRRLRKADLIDALLEHQGANGASDDAATDDDAEENGTAASRRRRGRRGGRSRATSARDTAEDEEEAEEEEEAPRACAHAGAALTPRRQARRRCDGSRGPRPRRG